jgi:hypothetical protein
VFLIIEAKVDEFKKEDIEVQREMNNKHSIIVMLNRAHAGIITWVK